MGLRIFSKKREGLYLSGSEGDKAMLKLSVFVAILAISVSGSVKQEGKIWAFLAATSNGWSNYRHQADLCHAYQLLRDNGIPAENIITMFYDDIANSQFNKDKGVIINMPGGPNVYKGVAKDYTGQEVNVENFFNILAGNKEAMNGKGTERVIESGPNDHVFVYIVDHGDTGVLLFPNDEYMYAHKLTQQLRQMKKDNRFKKMVMYIEACKAGSMFDNILDDDLHVFVSTASATDEFSWARYCDTLDTCLGDYYSTVWMEHMDQIRENWSAKYTSLFKQYKYTRTNVNKSHVNIYGDYRLGFDKVSTFLGDDWVHHNKPTELIQLTPNASPLDNSVVITSEIPVYLLRSKIKKTYDPETRKQLKSELDKLLKERYLIDVTMEKIIRKMSKGDNEVYKNLFNNERPSLTEDIFPCYEDIINKFNKHCFNTYKNSYVTRHFYKLANMCKTGYPTYDFISALETSCDHTHRSLTNVN